MAKWKFYIYCNIYLAELITVDLFYFFLIFCSLEIH